MGQGRMPKLACGVYFRILSYLTQLRPEVSPLGPWQTPLSFPPPRALPFPFRFQGSLGMPSRTKVPMSLYLNLQKKIHISEAYLGTLESSLEHSFACPALVVGSLIGPGTQFSLTDGGKRPTRIVATRSPPWAPDERMYQGE